MVHFPMLSNYTPTIQTNINRDNDKSTSMGAHTHKEYNFFFFFGLVNCQNSHENKILLKKYGDYLKFFFELFFLGRR